MKRLNNSPIGPSQPDDLPDLANLQARGVVLAVAVEHLNEPIGTTHQNLGAIVVAERQARHLGRFVQHVDLLQVLLAVRLLLEGFQLCERGNRLATKRTWFVYLHSTTHF